MSHEINLAEVDVDGAVREAADAVPATHAWAS